jgi:ABC-type uncharacterized transport system permease subunit
MKKQIRVRACLAILLMALARFIWRVGVRSYSGASA